MLSMVSITLSLTRDIEFPFLHGNIVFALLCKALGLARNAEFPKTILPIVPESGRCQYDEGAPYAFGLVLLDDGLNTLPTLLKSLQCLGRTDAESDRTPLGGNFRLETIFDHVTGVPLTEGEPPEPLGSALLNQAAESMATQKRIGLRLFSPLRLHRSQACQSAGHKFCDDDLFEADRFMGNLMKRAHDLAPSLLPRVSNQAPQAIEVEARPSPLLWLDMAIHNHTDTVGGVVGDLELYFPGGIGPAAWYLLLGQYLGVGKNVNHGFGRYRLFNHTPLPQPPRRAEALTTAAARQGLGFPEDLPEESLEEDDVAFEDQEFETTPIEESDLGYRELDAMARARHKPAPLRGRVMAGASGKIRALAVPSALDQALQRRVHELIRPSVEALLESSSYAYRRGLSRAGAATALRRAYDQGLRWVLRADVAAFFDSVDWELLRHKLTALWDDDPVVDLFMDWTRAPVRFGDQLIHRDRGLPQGAVISPLLANLFLDEFDEEVAEAGFKLIRYADDFAVCCRNREQAEKAAARIRESLSDLGLSLNEAKSQLTTFDAGFTFLGYAFCRSMILDEVKTKTPPVWLENPDDAPPGSEPEDFWTQAVKSVPKGAWLADLDPSQSFPLTSTEVRRYKTRPTSEVRAQGRQPVYLTSPETSVRLFDGRLVITLGDARQEIPQALVESLIVVGHVHLNGTVIRHCLRQGIPIHFLTVTGSLIGGFSLPGDLAVADTIRAQAVLLVNQELVRRFTAGIVSAKIGNSRVVIRRQKHRTSQDEETLAEMMEMIRLAQRVPEIDRLRALEGQAAKLHFQRLRAHLPPAFGFEARVARPAPDPINAMLSFGYSLVHRQMSAFLTIEGLNPFLGIYHLPSDRYHSLAADLTEEFRFMVEQDGPQTCPSGSDHPTGLPLAGKVQRMPSWTSRPGKAFIRRWQTRLNDTLNPEPTAEPISVRRLMHRQVKRLKAVHHGTGNASL